ncbi:MAG: cell wall/surface repeat protein [Mucilaginibacter sp.]|uniref:ice-binding family protein n=1 Tax=Mucilaginibacter sp. TaxID=1882438 RepID=UPI002630669D|nr:ice-binding family protein [Mucilaginibacter sp.]MDB5004712.1 cell wall/surface repeat protein [Mucilaginibacter sp.]
MKKKSTPTSNSTQVCKSRGYSKKFLTIWSLVLLFVVFTTGCKKDKFVAAQGVCPTVVTDPMDKAVDVVLPKVISATFNTDMDAATITKATFIIKQGANAVSGTVAATGNAKVYTFTPDVPLLPFVVYTGTITTGAADKFHTALVTDQIWTFTTIPQVSTSVLPLASGTTTGAGTYAQGATASVTATAATGFVFTNWTDGATVASTSPSYQFTMAGNRALVANFTAIAIGKVALNLQSNPVAGGTVTGQGQFATGSTVIATATPNAGYSFINWTDNGTIVSTSSSYQFVLAANRTLTANFSLVAASQFAVVLASSPVAGGSTTGSGSYPSGTSVTATAFPNTGYTFFNWTENTVQASTSAAYTFPLTANKTLVANFVINTYTLNVTATNGTVAKNPNQPTYNYGTTVQLTATANPGFIFSSWSGDASGSVNPLTVSMTSNKNITANFTAVVALGPTLPGLGGAANFTILTESGISTTGVTSVTGDIGVSPITSTAITGFGLIMDPSGQTSHTPIVSGKVYAADYAVPTPGNLTTAVGDMETAYTNSNNLVTPAPVVGLGAGDISGLTLPPGLYKWSTQLLITNAGVTLSGGANDTWVFQIGSDLIVNNTAIIHLIGGAQAKNIYWVVAGQATLGTSVNFSGNILSKNLISLNTGTTVTGRLLAQKAVTLNASTVIIP